MSIPAVMAATAAAPPPAGRGHATPSDDGAFAQTLDAAMAAEQPADQATGSATSSEQRAEEPAAAQDGVEDVDTGVAVEPATPVPPSVVPPSVAPSALLARATDGAAQIATAPSSDGDAAATAMAATNGVEPPVTELADQAATAEVTGASPTPASPAHAAAFTPTDPATPRPPLDTYRSEPIVSAEPPSEAPVVDAPTDPADIGGPTSGDDETSTTVTAAKATLTDAPVQDADAAPPAPTTPGDAALASATTSTAQEGHAAAAVDGVSVDGPNATTATSPEPTTPTPARAPGAPSPANQIATAVAALRRQGDGTFETTLELNPAELGRLRIVLSISGGVVDVALSAEQQGTRTLLGNELDQLRQALTDGGLQTGDLDVRQDGWGRDGRHGQDGRADRGGTPEADQTQGTLLGRLALRAPDHEHPTDRLDLLV